MSRRSRMLVLLGLCGIAGAAGCAEQKKPGDLDKAAEQASLLKQCQDELARLQGEMQQKLADLERENGELKAKLVGGGAPKEGAPPPGWKTIPGGAMIALDGTVLFDSGKAALKRDGQKTLSDIAATLKSKYAGYDVYVVGHTDNVPIRHSPWKDNYELSCQRSLSVVRFLMTRGIEPKSLAACGWGEFRPVTPNSSAAERKFNRRVEIFAMAPFGNRAPRPEASNTGTP